MLFDWQYLHNLKSHTTYWGGDGSEQILNTIRFLDFENWSTSKLILNLMFSSNLHGDAINAYWCVCVALNLLNVGCTHFKCCNIYNFLCCGSLIVRDQLTETLYQQ